MGQKLRRTIFHPKHIALKANMVEFGGWDMPLNYAKGIIAEHIGTRTAAGLFDVSHMGRFIVRGPEALPFLQYALTNDASRLDPEKTGAQYTLIPNQKGGAVDDAFLYRFKNDEYLLVVNASNRRKDLRTLRATLKRFPGAELIDRTSDLAMLALQGPQAVTALSRLAPGVEKLVFMTSGSFTVDTGAQKIEVFLTRSGYTGEDGFEISVDASDAMVLAKALLAQPEVKPIGLGARNSLRLEAGLPLYGNDINTTTTPVEAGLQWAIQKVRRAGGARMGGFPGADKILAQLGDEAGSVTRKRVGLKALARIPVREHVELQNQAGEHIGEVTSGLLGPTIDQPIAMGYVPPALATLGSLVNAIVRGKPVKMEVVTMPFVPTNYFRG